MTGPNHSIICFFTGAGHGAAAWMTVSSDDTSYFVPRVLGKFEHAHEHRRYDLAVGDVVLLDERQVLLGIEVFHRHDGGADGVDRKAEAQRRSMVEGRRREVALGVVHAEQELQQTLHRAR